MASEDAPVSDINAQKTLGEPPSINLIDHTAPTDELGSGSELSRAPTGISKTLTQGSIRQTIARRKYQRSKWQEGKGSQSYIKYPPDVAEAGEGSSSKPPGDSLTNSRSLDDAEDDTWGKGRVRRGGKRVKAAIRASKQNDSKPYVADPDSHIDILYENQRGFFFAGIPRFSSNSLLNFDPSAWLDSRYRPSAVNITNAQVPDPSWDWSWRCWYVDMSGDVDEEGWEYSFWFGKGTAWHGTHPWFHSFVRRRRWLRKRSKRKTVKAKEEGHAMTSDYFTIHSKMRSTEMDMDSLGASEKKPQYPVATSSAWAAKSSDGQDDVAEVTNIPDLLRGLRTAAIDREKIVLVRTFLNSGRAELHYLAENMEHIMKLLVFQNSRKQLLAILMHEFEAAEQHRDEHKDNGEEESDEEKMHLDNLLKALEAADEQCKHLEYWSDIKGMAREGEILRASDHVHGWDHGWEGLDTSGPDARAGTPPDDKVGGEKPSSAKHYKGKQPAREKNKTEQPQGCVNGSSGATAATRAPTASADDMSRPSMDSSQRDVFYPPEGEKTEAQATDSPSTAHPEPTGTLAPSQESQISLDTYESAHSEPEDDDGEDDAATERAPSEDGRDPNIPPTATAPVVEAMTQVLNGHTKDDQGTASRKYAEEGEGV